jgi:hypothetical protein
MVCMLVKERNTCAIIGDLNGRMTASDHGGRPRYSRYDVQQRLNTILTDSYLRHAYTSYQNVLEKGQNKHMPRSYVCAQYI